MTKQSNTSNPEGHPRALLVDVLAFLWAVVRMPLFMVLMWLRAPVLIMFNLLGSLASLCFVFGLLFFREKHSILWSLGGMSFAAFALRWAYDSLLLWLSPEEIILY